MITIGERVKSTFTGKVYEVKRIIEMSVVLESEDGKSQVLTERGNLNLFYEKVENDHLSKELNFFLHPRFKNTDKF
jgi:hypothetical protein